MSQYTLPFGFCFLIFLPSNSHLQSLPIQRVFIWDFTFLGIHFPLSFFLWHCCSLCLCPHPVCSGSIQLILARES